MLRLKVMSVLALHRHFAGFTGYPRALYFLGDLLLQPQESPGPSQVTSYLRQHGLTDGSECAIKHALGLIEHAAAQGFCIATDSLAGRHLCGANVKQDFARAVELLHCAVRSGCDSSLFSLGAMYDDVGPRLGVPRDEDKACEWYARAAAKHNEFAKYKLSVIRAVCRTSS